MAGDVSFQVTADVSQATTALQGLQSSMQGVQTAMTGANSGLANFGSKMSALGGKLTGIGKTMAVAVSLPLAIIGKQMLETGSNMKAFESAYSASFKGVEDSANAWASQTVKAIGLTDNQVKQSMLTFNKYAKGMGMAGKEALGFSEKMVTLTSDLSAFNDVPMEEASDRMKSALMGNFEAVDALGLSFSEATIKQQMLKDGIKGQYSALDEATKMQVLYNLAVSQSADVVGQVNRESDSYAVKMQKLKGTMADLYEKVFVAIEPYVTSFVDGSGKVVGWFGKLSPNAMLFVSAVGAILIVLPPLLIIIGSLITSVGAISTAIATAGGVMAILTAPVTIVIASIVALIAVFVLLYNHNEAFRAKVQEVWGYVKVFIAEAVKSIMTIVSVVMAFLTELWKKHGDQIMAIVNTAFGVIVAVFKSALQIISGVFKVFAVLLTGDWEKVWQGLKQIVSGVWNAITSVISGGVNLVKNTITTALNVALSVVEGIVKGIKNALVSAFQFVIPKIKLPHFPINGSFSLSPPSIPSIGVNWYANGGIVDSPTAGIFGEAGKEALVPMYSSKAMKDVGLSVAQHMPDNVAVNGSGDTVNINIYNPVVKDEMDINRLADTISEKIYKAQERNRRAKGQNK